MKSCIFSSPAADDLREIYDYIAERDLDTALDFTTRIQLACDNLANMPEMGRAREELAKGLRSLVVGRHTSFYRLTDDGVEIVRILHGARDVLQIFGDE